MSSSARNVSLSQDRLVASHELVHRLVKVWNLETTYNTEGSNKRVNGKLEVKVQDGGNLCFCPYSIKLDDPHEPLTHLDLLIRLQANGNYWVEECPDPMKIMKGMSGWMLALDETSLRDRRTNNLNAIRWTQVNDSPLGRGRITLEWSHILQGPVEEERWMLKLKALGSENESAWEVYLSRRMKQEDR